MQLEDIRQHFATACSTNDASTVQSMLAENFEGKNSKFLKFLFEQGVLCAANTASIASLRKLLSCEDYKLPSMLYSTLFTSTDNEEVMECLALHLDDMAELEEIAKYEQFPKKDKFLAIFNTRVEKIFLSSVVAETKKSSLMKI